MTGKSIEDTFGLDGVFPEGEPVTSEELRERNNRYRGRIKAERTQKARDSAINKLRKLGLAVLTAGVILGGSTVYYLTGPFKETDYYKVNMAPPSKIEACAGTSIEDLARKEGIERGDPRYHRYAVKLLRMNDVYVGPNEMKRIGNDGLVSLDSTGVYALDVDRDGDYSGKQPMRK